jgi:hypothetical protein
MSYPSEVYSYRGRVKIWVPTCKDCAKFAHLKSDVGKFIIMADPATDTDKIMTSHDRDEVWAALENATINLTSFGESFVPLVDVLKAACESNAKARNLYGVHSCDDPEDVERNNKAVWPVIHEIIAMSDSGKYPSFKIDESTRDGSVLYVTYRRSPSAER